MPSHHSPRSESTEIFDKKKCEKNTILCKTKLKAGALMENIPDGSTSPSRQVLYLRQAESNFLIGLNCKTIICTFCSPYAYSYGTIWSHIPRILATSRSPIRRIGSRSYLCKGKLEAEIHWLRNKRVINNSPNQSPFRFQAPVELPLSHFSRF